MRYFLDTEFNEEREHADLISIGMVADDGREFYAINHHYADPTTEQAKSCNDWVKKHVFPNLFMPSKTPGYNPSGSRAEIRDGITEFVGNDPFPEFWAYYGDYDWYLTCRLFGRFDQQPKAWVKAGNICYDVRQFARHVGYAKKHFPAKFEPEHNALVDARWTKKLFDDVVAFRDKTLTPAQIQETWP